MNRDVLAGASGKSVAVALAGGTIGVAVLLMLPAFIGVLAHDYGLGDKQAGIFSFADLGGLTVGSAIGANLLLKVGPRKTAASGFALAVITNLATMLVTNFFALVSLRIMAGLGSGLVVSMCYAVIGRSRHVDRNFSLYVVCQVSFGTLALHYMPRLSAIAGGAGLFGILALLLLVTLPFSLQLPISLGQPSGCAGGKRLERAAWASLVSILAFFCAQGGVWGYLELMAVRNGVDSQAADNALAAATLVGLAGPVTAAFLGARFGRTLPISAGLILLALSSILLGAPLDAFRFLLASSLFLVAWNLIIPYQLAAIAEVDSTGQVVSWAASLSLGGLAVGPLLAALVLDHGGFTAVLWLSGALCLLGFCAMLPALSAGSGKQIPTQST